MAVMAIVDKTCRIELKKVRPICFGLFKYSNTLYTLHDKFIYLETTFPGFLNIKSSVG